MKTICIDPGHGMGNRRTNVYDSGAESSGYTEAEIVMDWANVLRSILIKQGAKVVRTRVDAKDPDPVGKRADIARKYNAEIMLSLHCNAADGKANGTETFYRGKENAAKAKKLNDAVRLALVTKDRGIKTESQSQHSTLAVMSFQPCFLVELGFIDNVSDRAKMLDPALRQSACEALASVLLS